MRHFVNSIILTLIMILLAVGTIPDFCLAATSEIRLSRGQTVYVPAYSNVFTGPRKLPFQLATSLSVRNTDPSASLQITAIDYYDTNGKWCAATWTVWGNCGRTRSAASSVTTGKGARA